MLLGNGGASSVRSAMFIAITTAQERKLRRSAMFIVISTHEHQAP